MTIADTIGDIPAIDHHSHASAYVGPDGLYRSVADLEEHFVTGHLESRVPDEVYREYIDARNRHDRTALDALDSQHGIYALLEKGAEFRSTTFFATALRRGCEMLYGDYSDQEDLAKRGKYWREKGESVLYTHALDMANTPVVLTDVKSIDVQKWSPERYKQIVRIDPYLYPFGHAERSERGTEAARFMNIFSGVLKDELSISGLSASPSSLPEYLEFVLGSLKRRCDAGAVGFKFASAYVRSLAFSDVDEHDAARAYTDLKSSGRGDRQSLENYLAFRMAEYAADNGFPLQIHVGMGHPEPGMYIRNANPLNLEDFLSRPSLNRLKVIMIHGAYPFTSEAAALAQTYGNVHLDFSWMPYLHHFYLRQKLSEWLEILPANKLIFGTDTGAPEFHVSGTAYARESLALVLEGGFARGVWTAQQTDYLAERVLYSNAAELYGI